MRWIVRFVRPVARERRLAAAAAAKVSLARHELSTRRHISARRLPIELPAQAWVEAACRIVIGTMPSPSRYARLFQRAGAER